MPWLHGQVPAAAEVAPDSSDGEHLGEALSTAWTADLSSNI